MKEFALNFVDADEMVSVTAYQRKMISKLTKLAEDHPDEVKIVAVNDDGTVCAHLLKKYVKVSFGEPKTRTMTAEQKVAAAERLRLAREKKNGDGGDAE